MKTTKEKQYDKTRRINRSITNKAKAKNKNKNCI